MINIFEDIGWPDPFPEPQEISPKGTHKLPTISDFHINEFIKKSKIQNLKKDIKSIYFKCFAVDCNEHIRYCR